MNELASSQINGEPALLFLEIVTPEGRFYEGNAALIELPAATGEIGIYPGHVRLFTALSAGEIKIHGTEGRRSFIIAGGHAQIEPHAVHVLALFAAAEDEKVKIEEACQRAQTALEQAGNQPPEQIEDELALIRIKLEQGKNAPGPKRKPR